MDAFVKAETYEYSAYLTTAREEVYRIWFGGDGMPLMEMLTPDGQIELNMLRRRYDGTGRHAHTQRAPHGD